MFVAVRRRITELLSSREGDAQPQPQSSATRRALTFAAALGVAAVGLWFALSGVSWSALSRSLAEYHLAARPEVAAFALLAYLALTVSHAARLLLLLRRMARPRFGAVFLAHGLASLLNLVLPSRAGDLYKAHRLASASGLSFSQCLAVAGSDVLYWLLALVVLALGLATEQSLSELRAPVAFIGAAGVAGLAGLYLVDAVWVRRAQEPAAKLWRAAHQFVRSCRAALAPTALLTALPVALIGWACEVAVLLALAALGGQQLSFGQGFAVCAAATLAMAVPAPAGLGPFEAASKFVLTQFGLSENDALALALVYHAFMIALPALVGVSCLGWVALAKPQRPAPGA